MKIEMWSDPFTENYVWVLGGWFVFLIRRIDLVEYDWNPIHYLLEQAIKQAVWLSMPGHE